MRTRLQLIDITRVSLLGALICTAPMLARAAGKERGSEGAPNFRSVSPREQTARLERRSELRSKQNGVSKDYIRQRLDWLRMKDQRHFRVFAYFDTLIDLGYDPLVLDTWLDGLYDGVVVVGMPGELVLDYYGQPVFENEIVYEGAPAQVWGERLLPGRVEKVTVAGGKVVRVTG